MLRRTICRGASAAAPRAPLTFGNMHGFELISTRAVPELNLVAYEMTHTRTGAAYYHIDIDDTNNTFCIGFRTPAENDKGTSHVLEHTTLCGSKKYPIRDPFFMMMKRSLSNFMNAMTGADYTLYPFATTNAQDFSNLLDVYLDAVFHPLLREEDFWQEGHRVELEAAGGAGDGADVASRRLINNGVVYNEMRGVVSEPNRFFSHSLTRLMLPGTHYEYISGGNPPAILDLTHEELLDFHRRHYNPSNSITFTYGDRHPATHMAALDAYFADFERRERVAVPTLPDSARFAAPREVHLEGPLNPMGNPRQQKRVAVAYGVPQRSNRLQDVVELSVLDSLLSSGPSSPMFQALIESHIGARYAPMRGYAYYLSSPIVSYGVAGVDEAADGVEARVREAVAGALRAVQRDGFDARRVRSVVFQEELNQRHRSADNGINLCTGLCAMGLCRAHNSPLDFLNWLPHLQRIQADGAASLLPRIASDLLDNPHQAVLSVSAGERYLADLQAELRRRDDALNEGATAERKAEVLRATEDWLSRVRAPQPPDVLPTLRPDDIPTAAFQEPAPQPSAAAGVYTLAYPTNGLVYVHGLLPFAPALHDALSAGRLESVSRAVPLVEGLLASTGAGPHSFKEQSVETELVCGGFSFANILNESYAADGRTVAGVSYGFYTTAAKLGEALDLLALTLLEPRVSAADPEVASQSLARLKGACSGLVQMLQSRGHHVAAAAAASRLTTRAALRERWWGLQQCRHASTLLERLQAGGDEERRALGELLAEYGALAAALPAAVPHGTHWATCEEGDRAAVEAQLARFVARFPADAAARRPLHVDMPPLPATTATGADGADGSAGVVHERLPIDTAFVGYALPRPALGWRHPDQAPARLAALLLSNEFLHRRVREEGGAYGSSCSATLSGAAGGISMSSYRDPSPDRTVAAFRETAEWLAAPGSVSDTRVAEAKLRLFSSLDAPYAADSFGEARFYNEVQPELKQRMRDELLATTADDVLRVSKYFAPDGASVCVLQGLDKTAAE